MAQQHPHPTSLDVSRDDYSIGVFCRPSCVHLENKSIPYTRLPSQVTITLQLYVLLVSSSDPENSVSYQHTHEKITLPSHEVFSDDQCRKSVKELIPDLILLSPPISLNERKLQWTAERRDSAGRVLYREKLLEDSRGLVSELVEYIQKTRDSPPLAVQELGFDIKIKKLVTQPDSVIDTWRRWCYASWDEYQDFVYRKPRKYLRGLRTGLKALQKMRQRTGDFDEADECCICISKLSGGGPDGCSEVTRLPCRHVYHESCLLVWFNVRSSCPYCRLQVPLFIHHLRHHTPR